MDAALSAEVRVFADLSALAGEAAARVADWIDEDVAARGSCTIALSGGNTPRGLYAMLATEYADRIPWSDVHLFWGDERYVPWNDARSNYHMVRDVLLRHVPIPPKHVQPMPTDIEPPAEAAEAYETALRNRFATPRPRFDLVLLGMGADGHTASLFPGSPALNERERWVMATRAPADPPQRLTFTLPVLNAAARVCFLVSGEAKAEAVRCALESTKPKTQCPAGAVRPTDGALHWWIDRAAASRIEPGAGL